MACVPHAEVTVVGHASSCPCVGFMALSIRATLHSRSSRSPPRPPGDGTSKSSQNAGWARPQEPRGGAASGVGRGTGPVSPATPVELAPLAPALPCALPLAPLAPPVGDTPLPPLGAFGSRLGESDAEHPNSEMVATSATVSICLMMYAPVVGEGSLSMDGASAGAQVTIRELTYRRKHTDCRGYSLT